MQTDDRDIIQIAIEKLKHHSGIVLEIDQMYLLEKIIKGSGMNHYELIISNDSRRFKVFSK